MDLKEIQELTVYRDLWARGLPDGATLLNRDGMCCLGFACQAIGVPEHNMWGVGEPSELEPVEDGDEIPGLVVGWDIDGRIQSPLVQRAIEVNDNIEMSGKEREELLQAAFAEAGIALSFEDTAPESIRDAYEAVLLDQPGALAKVTP